MANALPLAVVTVADVGASPWWWPTGALGVLAALPANPTIVGLIGSDEPELATEPSPQART